MDYEKQVDPRRISRGMRDRIEALGSTADMVEVCVEVAEREVRALEKHYEGKTGELYGDWRTIVTLLRLAGQQNDIVKSVVEDFYKEDLRSQAA